MSILNRCPAVKEEEAKLQLPLILDLARLMPLRFGL